MTNRQVGANHNSVMQKGFLHGMFVFHQFLFMKQTYDTSTDFEDIFTDHVTWCILSVIALSWNWGGGWVGWGGLISNLNSVRLQFTAVSWKKGYSCYISFFTNFALIYRTCLIRFGGKFHRSCNLAHSVRDLD